MQLTDIQMRDPFVLADQESKTYYLYGTTDKDPWKARGVGFDAYQSKDLLAWEGPVTVFSPDKAFWGTHNFWAPEVHRYRGHYYLFASFKAENRCRGTQILSSASPLGSFVPVSAKPATPEGWECLDGTLHVDQKGKPWIIFCHEWVQVNDGQICATPLCDDLSEPIAEPVVLFHASDAAWTKNLVRRDGSGLVDARVTDGPFLHTAQDGTLLMLWSSVGQEGYVMGYATSTSGSILGPWIQSTEPLIVCDGGHGMIFTSFEGLRYLTYHSPNKTPNERPFFARLEERDGSLACL